MLKVRAGQVLALVILSLAIGVRGEQHHTRPLPDQDAFLEETRKHLQTDASLQSSYVYIETRREAKLDKNGRPTSETVRVYESYPGLPGEERWERLVAEDGKPIPAKQLAEQDRERQQRAMAMARRMTTEPAKEHTRQKKEWEKYRRERGEAVEDIYRVFDIQMVGRERIEGHETIAFALTPKPNAKPKTREGDQMRHFHVRAWISESDHELVRLDAEAVDNLSFGLGVLAKLHKGARLTFLRRKINDEVWLPAVVSYSGNARVGLLWMLRRSGTSEYSGYRKYSVDTSSTFSSHN